MSKVIAGTLLTGFLFMAALLFFDLMLSTGEAQHAAHQAALVVRVEQLRTGISVDSVAVVGSECASSHLEVDTVISNTGEVAFTDLSEMDLFANYTSDTGGAVASRLEYVTGTLSDDKWKLMDISPDNYGANIWDPQEVATLRLWLSPPPQPSSQGTVTMSTPQGITTSEYVSFGYPMCWWNGSWLNRIKITFNNSAQTENLTNFPVLVSLTSAQIDYAKTQNQGQDIRFIDADRTTELSYEVEKWDEAGTSVVWVKVPQIDGSSNTDHIWMYYNNTGALDAQNATAVWSNGYAGVWHLKEDPSGVAPQMKDSTNVNQGTSNGDMTSDDQVAGQVDGALDLDGVDDKIQITSLMGQPANVTLAAWVRLDAADTGGATLISLGSHTTIRLDDPANGSGTKGNFYDGDSWLTTKNSIYYAGTGWHYIVYVRDDTNNAQTLYVDGAPSASTTHTESIDYSGLGSDTIIGRHANGQTTRDLDGVVDEARVSNVARSADWIAAQHKSMNGAFNTFGPQETR